MPFSKILFLTFVRFIHCTMYEYFAYTYAYAPHALLVPEKIKRADLELGLSMVVNHHVWAEN